MPSVTSLSQYTLQNLGPLTTTFTAPESCATLEPPVALARTKQPSLPYWMQECNEVDDSLAACLPSGRAYFDIFKNDSEAARPPSVIAYFSPGLHCPESWTTAGVAVKDADGSVVSTSGIYAAGATASPSPTSSGPVSGSDEWFESQLLSFDGTSYASPGPSSGSDEYFKDKLLSFDGTSYASPEKTPSPAAAKRDGSAPSGSDDYFKTKLLSFDGTSYASPEKTSGPADDNVAGSAPPRINPIPNILLEALGAGETAVACCPSGYTAQQNQCYSNTPASAYTAPTGCQRAIRSGQVTWVPATFTWGDAAVTGGSEISWTGTASPYYSVVSTTFPTGTAAATAESYTGVVHVAMLTLVHGGSGDADGGDKANSTEEQPQAGESSGSGSDNAESAAVPGARAADVGKVVVAWVVAALVGALVVFPS